MIRPGAPLLDSLAVSGDGRHVAVGSSQQRGFWLYKIVPPQVRIGSLAPRTDDGDAVML